MATMKYVLLMSLSLVIISCGGDSKKWVTDVNVATANQGGESWLVSDFKVDIGEDNELPFLNLPLPKNYGVFRSWRHEGENFMGVDLNLTSILDVTPSLGTLPNGQPIPINVGDAGIVEVYIEGINGRVYLAHAEGMTLVGLAVAIKQMDNLVDEAVGVFPRFNVGGFDVIAGLFTSGQPGGTGLGIFANIGSLWDKALYDSFAFKYRTEYVSRSTKRKLYKKVKRLMKKRMKLDFAE